MFHFRYVAAEVEGVAQPHYNGASGWSADPIHVIADGFHRSVALDGIGQMQGLGHGITLKSQPSYAFAIGPGCDNRYRLGFLCVSQHSLRIEPFGP